MKVFEEKHEPKIHEFKAYAEQSAALRKTVKERNVSVVPGRMKLSLSVHPQGHARMGRIIIESLILAQDERWRRA